MTPPDGSSVRAAVGAVRHLLGRVPDGNAEVPAMGCSVTAVAAHLNSCLAFYAHDLAAGPSDVSGMDVVPRPQATLAELTAGLAAWGEVLARTVGAAGPDDRGSHSDGIADAAGFAAIGCAELLVHGTDVAAGLGLSWEPPADVAAAVRARHFPEVPATADAVADLLWATGRLELPGALAGSGGPTGWPRPDRERPPRDPA